MPERPSLLDAAIGPKLADALINVLPACDITPLPDQVRNLCQQIFQAADPDNVEQQAVAMQILDQMTAAPSINSPHTPDDFNESIIHDLLRALQGVRSQGGSMRFPPLGLIEPTDWTALQALSLRRGVSVTLRHDGILVTLQDEQQTGARGVRR